MNVPEDPDREDRIIMEIVVDAYGEGERAMGWYCYLDNTFRFPFKAVCGTRRSISPLKPKQRVEVISLAESDECDREIFVTVRWGKDEELCVPLAQLRAVGADDETRRAVEDWAYWVARGYRF